MLFSTFSHRCAIGVLLLLTACGGGQDQEAQLQKSSRLAGSVASSASAPSDYHNMLQKLYVGYFGRPADPSGLAYFAEKYAEAGAPTDIIGIEQVYHVDLAVKGLVDSFATSAESQALYPGDNGVFVDAIYHNLFNRDPDPEGKAFWVGAINNGVLTRANAAVSIMAGARGADIEAINKKAEVAGNFTSTLATVQLTRAYIGPQALAVARSMLTKVSANTNVAAFYASINDAQATIMTSLAQGLRKTQMQAIGAPPPLTIAVPAWSIADVIGTYRLKPDASNNPYTLGTISLKPNSSTELEYTNQAGTRMNLRADISRGLLLTDDTNPYKDNLTSGINFVLQFQDGKLVGYRTNNMMFWRDNTSAVVARDAAETLGGYFLSDLAKAPAGFTSGFSMYTAIWPMIDQQLQSVSHGLAGTWINPDNEDFTQPLLPAGHPMRELFPSEAANYWRTLFQSIEGSAGYWANTRYASTIPKYRINGTANGYEMQLAAPGWPFGGDAIAAGANGSQSTGSGGLAQLSNRILVPPDGMTFRDDTAGELLGVAWMALPLTLPKSGTIPVGDQSWTVFLKATNFQGPVAFYLPDVWVGMARSYPTVAGRGLDTRPAQIKTLVMELQFRYFLGSDGKGNDYLKLQRMSFPTDSKGATTILADFTLYSADAVSNPVRDWINGGTAPARFAAASAIRPDLDAGRFTFSSSSGLSIESFDGFDSVVRMAATTTAQGGSTFGLQWADAKSNGVFPEYYKKQNGRYVPVAAESVPAATGLKAASFDQVKADGFGTAPYTSPSSWSVPPPAAGPYTVKLNDGSTVTYAWYRFIDQPSLQGFSLSEAEKARLQSVVEKLHSGWSGSGALMAPPSIGTLATMDAALLVTPPAGLEKGFVPVVTHQER